MRSGAIDHVVDSVAALVPKAELEGDMGDSHVGLHARLMSQALKAHGIGTEIGHDGLVYQSAAHEDWRYVRQSRDHDWW